MSDEKNSPDADIDPLEATTEADVSDGSEQKKPPVDAPDTPDVVS
jgi:hypothetical protein